ncbi:MAG: hypothetical protein ACO1OF_16520 [Adhaeribacter sp.]
MRKLFIAGLIVPLQPGSSLSFDISTGIIDLLREEATKGSHSLPFTIPDTPEAKIAFDFQNNLDNRQPLPESYPAIYEDGSFYFKGDFNLLGYIPKVGWRGNLVTAENSIVKKLKATKLKDLILGGIQELGARPDDVLFRMQEIAENPDRFNYVFAPVYNPEFYKENEDYQVLGGYYLNNWENLATVAGNPGLFKKGYETHPYGPGVGTSQAICPFPYLHYVVKEAFKEIGLTFTDNFFDEELKKLTILCNAALDEFQTVVDEGDEFPQNVYRKAFQLKEVLPDLNLHELLRKLQNTFGLQFNVKLNGQIVFNRIENVLNSPNRQDLTGKLLKAPEREMPTERGIILNYRKESEDSLTTQGTPDFTDVIVKAPVASLAALNQLLGDAELNEVRFVTELEEYWRLEETFEKFGKPLKRAWVFFSHDYKPLELGTKGDGTGQAFTMGIALTPDKVRGHREYNLKAPLATWVDFEGRPADGNTPEVKAVEAELNDVRLNLFENKYYIYNREWQPNEGTRSEDWLFFADNAFPPLRAWSMRKWKVPSFSAPGYSPAAGQTERSKELRLAFYRGMQPYDNTNATYPMLSGSNFNAVGFKVGNYALKWHGPYGLANQFLQSWLKLMVAGKTIKGDMLLTEDEIANLDLNQLYTIEGQRAILKNLKFTLPLKKAPQAELQVF